MLSRMEVFNTRSGQRAGAGWTRVTRGAHRAVDPRSMELATLRAWSSILPPDASFTHVTGARLLGLWLPPGLESVPVTVHLPPRTSAPRRPGLRVIQSERTGRVRLVRGLPVASTCDVLLSLCRDLHELDALQAVDAALHLRLVTAATLHGAAQFHRRGAPRLRTLLPLSDDRTESPWETVLREFHRVAGVEVTPQFEVHDEEGFVARGDLRLVGHRILHEYDGGVHRTVQQHRADLVRDRRLHRAGWSRRGYSAA